MRTVRLDGQTYRLPPCPRCGSPNTALIIDGYPSRAATLAARRRLVCVAGCMSAPPVPGEPPKPPPTHTCWDCDHDWREENINT